MAQQESESNRWQKPLRGALVYSQEEGYKLVSIALNVGPGEYSRVLVGDETYLVGVEGAREHGQELYTFPVLDGTRVHVMLVSSLDEQYSTRYLMLENGVQEQESPHFGLEIVEEPGFFSSEPEDLDADLQRGQSEAPALEDFSFWQADLNQMDQNLYKGAVIYRQQRGYMQVALTIEVLPGEQSQVIIESNGFLSKPEPQRIGIVDLYHFPVVNGARIQTTLISSMGERQEALYRAYEGKIMEEDHSPRFRLAVTDDEIAGRNWRKPLPLKEYPTWKDAFTDTLSYYGEKALLWFRDGLDTMREGLDAMIEKLDYGRNTFGR